MLQIVPGVEIFRHPDADDIYVIVDARAETSNKWYLLEVTRAGVKLELAYRLPKGIAPPETRDLKQDAERHDRVFVLDEGR